MTSSKDSKIVTVSSLSFTRALPRRNFGEYVEEELVQRRCPVPFVSKEWFRAMIRLFDAVVRLICLEMEQDFCEIILYHITNNMLNSMEALT